ncbi:unnamed protein product [Heterosigma akashiwo]|mmetsp:Transcript_21639/g.34163  ORF Transcript_21639/g.34163 Transcript_21639/m.34163 type:complete len:186 (+) Transcript_21639:70-627(+)
MAGHGHTPAWLTETPASTGGDPAPAQPGSSSYNYNQRETYEGQGRPIVVNTFRFINIGLSVFMAFAGVYGIFAITDFRLQEFFVSLYVMLFAALLFLHEVLTIPACSCWGRGNELLRRYFGFLYGTIGKALFLIFIAFLNLGLESHEQLGMAVAASLFGDGCAHLILYFKSPEWFPEKMPLPLRR